MIRSLVSCCVAYYYVVPRRQSVPELLVRHSFFCYYEFVVHRKYKRIRGGVAVGQSAPVDPRGTVVTAV